MKTRRAEKSLTKLKQKSVKQRKKLTKIEQDKLKKELKKQEKWVSKSVKELKKSRTWADMFFSSWNGYVKLLEYENVNTKKRNENLPHVAIHKLQKETVNNIKESFRQIEIINLHLHKKYKQDLLDSDELKHLLLNLANYQSVGGQLVTAERNSFGSLLFAIGLKILLESVEPELKERLINFVKDFNDLNAMVQRLTGNQMPIIKIEYDKNRRVVDIII